MDGVQNSIFSLLVDPVKIYSFLFFCIDEELGIEDCPTPYKEIDNVAPNNKILKSISDNLC